MDGHQQRHRDGQAEYPSAGREYRHVHMIEHEYLITEHRQPIQIFRRLLVRDGDDARLESRDVRLQGDRHLVAEAPLDAGAHRAQKPRASGPRRGQGDGRETNACAVAGDDAVGHHFEPEGEQRVRQRAEESEHERGTHEGGLVLIAEATEPPHGGERGG